MPFLLLIGPLASNIFIQSTPSNMTSSPPSNTLLMMLAAHLVKSSLTMTINLWALLSPVISLPSNAPLPLPLHAINTKTALLNATGVLLFAWPGHGSTLHFFLLLFGIMPLNGPQKRLIIFQFRSTVLPPHRLNLFITPNLISGPSFLFFLLHTSTNPTIVPQSASSSIVNPYVSSSLVAMTNLTWLTFIILPPNKSFPVPCIASTPPSRLVLSSIFLMTAASSLTPTSTLLTPFVPRPFPFTQLSMSASKPTPTLTPRLQY